MEKLSYENYDLEGNRYVVNASKGSIKNFNSNIIYMENVIATIYLKNFDTLIISSDNAILNNITFPLKITEEMVDCLIISIKKEESFNHMYI